MRGLARRLRSRGDYIVFEVANEWPILLSAAGVILGAAAILPTAVTLTLSVIVFTIGIVAFVHDVRRIRREWSDWEFSSIVAPFPAEAIPPPPSYPDAVYLHVPNRGTALVSTGIDQVVARRDLVANTPAVDRYVPWSSAVCRW
jgi:hypothetical protein